MTTQVLTMKRGDTAPAFRAQLLDDTTAVDLTTATSVRLLIEGQAAKVMTVTTAATGDVEYDWQTGDLAISGGYRGEVEVTWNNATVQTFPATGYFQLSVSDDVA